MNITQRKPFTPGEILQEEFLEPYQLTQTRLAEHIDVHYRRINEIINHKRAISTDTALRLAKFFGTTPEYWLKLQLKIELWEKMYNSKDIEAINRIKPINKAA